MKTSFIFVRHGQSMANLRHIIAGIYDAPISRLGLKQAEATAKYLKTEVIDAVYSSPIARAECTAQRIAAKHGLKVRVERGLEEFHFGDYEGVKMPKEANNDPVWQNYLHNFASASLPNGESTAEAGARFLRTVEKIAEKHPGQTVVVVNHSIVFSTFVLAVFGLEFASAHKITTNASVTRMDYEDGKFTLISYSEDKHLHSLNSRSKHFTSDI